ncbi:MAG: type II CRISPR RNA-guided endonuclease Cas9 [Nitrospira sp.]|nr:type II CRISPR RNA-guided endonuclease Cas9 [Nitrospira sp.]
MQNQHTAIVNRLKSVQTLPVREGIVFGLDVGIASCGWAVISTTQKKILGMGVHCFDPAEDPKTRVLKNATRREKRGQRRVIRRRAQRMNEVREVIREHGLLADPSHKFFQGLGKNAPDPWKSRVEGLNRSLTGEEAAAALIHIAKHRGFQSNSKSDKGQGAPEDKKKALSAMHETKNRLEKGGYRTFGELVLKAPKYPGLRRNREGDFSHTPRREWTKDEAKRIIEAQRDSGAQWATEKFEERYIKAAFHQHPLQSSENLVGKCPFEKHEKRTARYAYSFEKFRALQKLAWLEVIIPVPGDRPRHRHLTCAEIKKAVGNFGKQKSLTFKTLKKVLDLPEEAHFEQAPDEKKEKKDITGNTNGMCPGSYRLREKLGEEDWNSLSQMPDKLDRIAEILTFNESLDDICRKFKSEGLSEPVRKKLNKAAEEGEFNTFKGAGHISAKAVRNMIPYFFKESAQDRTYDKVCKAADYNHTVEKDGLATLRNPVVTQGIVKALKQVVILARHYQCRPVAIHVELLRDVGKSAKERSSIYKGNEERRNRKDKNRKALAELMEQDANYVVSAQALEMYELSKEQQYCCAYCGRNILPTHLTGNNAQIDHIFPRSRFSDGSFVNKVLTCVSCNQEKSKRTPWEWYESGRFPVSWEKFEARVKGFQCKLEKKRRLLNTNFQKRLDEDQQFANRHKVDSSYIARLVTAELRKLYPEDHEGGRVAKDRTRRILARPGPLTSMLRRAWLSKTMADVFGTAEKTREDDRHHAVDALTVASCDEKALQSLTRAYQKLEERGQYKWSPNVEPPWESFAEQAKDALNGWLVCRTESRRARGPGHEATIRRGSSGDVYERKPVEKLTEKDLEQIPDQRMREALRKHVQDIKQWREENKDKKAKKGKSVRPALPRSPKGDEIRKVRLKTDKQTVRQINAKHMGGRPDRKYHGGLVENTNMFRVDVYHVKKKREDSRNRKITPGYYLVPVYGWQVMDKKRKTPVNAIVNDKSEDKWLEMNPADFLFALYKDSYVEIVKKNDDAGKVIGGYYRSTDRTTGAVSVSLHNKRHEKDVQRGIGVKTLSSLRKFMVDRLGHKYEVKKEPWPGNKFDKCPGVVST